MKRLFAILSSRVGWIALAGVVLTFAVYHQVRWAAWDRLRTDFHLLAQERATLIEATLRRHGEDAEAVRRFLDSSIEVSREEFRRFAGPAARAASLQALQWVQQVPQAKRSPFEEALRREGLPNFQLTEQAADGGVVRAAERAEYFPVVYVEPMDGNAVVLGFDLASEPVRWGAMEQARDSGQIVASARVRLMQETEAQAGLLLFVPVYGGDDRAGSLEARRAHLRGFVVAALRAGDLMESALKPVRALGLPTQLLDLEAPAGQQLLHQLDPNRKEGEVGDAFAAAPPGWPAFEHTFAFAGRRWQVVTRPDADFMRGHLSTGYRWIAPAGLLLTGLLVLHLTSLASQHRRAEALVAERTAELRSSEALRRAIIEAQPECVKTVGPNGELLDMNPAGLAMLEAEAIERVRGRICTEFVAPEFREAFAALHRRVFTGEPGTLEFELIGLRGARRWIETRAVPFLDPKGGVRMLLAVTRDVTERKRAETAREAFLDLGARLSVARSPIEAARSIIDVADRLWRWDAATIDLYAASEDRVYPVLNIDTVAGNRQEMPPVRMPDVPSARLRRILANGSELILREPPYEPISDAVAFGDTTRLSASIMCVPIRQDREPVGVLSLQSYTPKAFTSGDLRMLEALAAHGGGALLRIQAEEQLKASEARYRGLVNHSVDLVFRLDLTGRFTFVNEAVHDLGGYRPEELIGQPVSLVLTEESLRVAEARRQQRQRGELGLEPFTQEYTFRRKDGSLFVAEIRSGPVLDASGKIVETQGTARDVTQRKEAEAALQRTSSTLRALVESQQTGILFEDTARRVVFANAAMRKLFGGRSPEDLIGVDSRETCARTRPVFADPEGWVEGIEQTLAVGEAVTELELKLKDGRIFERDYVPVRVESTLVGHLWQYRDVSNRRRLEEQLRQAQKMEAIGKLAGGVAHDFNNILTAMLLNLALSLDRSDLSPEVRESLRELEVGCHRAAALTRQLLLFGRQSILQISRVDLVDLLAETQKMLRRLIEAPIVLQFTTEPGLFAIEADPGMVQQVVVNLCVNARDAMPRGGRLNVSVANAELAPADVEARPEARPGRFVRLTVADTGFGMDEATLKRIFEPFFTTKDVGKGTGLGLATVHGIVQQHRGWIEVESQPGTGTTFHVFLPAAEPPGAEPELAPRRFPARTGSEVILLVEDEPAVRTTVALLLRRWGYRVVEARCGTEAMAILERDALEIDLLYTDMVLPEGMSGLELADLLRKGRPGLKVIVSSGYSADLQDPDAVRDAGILYLPKPCLADDLAVALGRCFDACGPA